MSLREKQDIPEMIYENRFAQFKWSVGWQAGRGDIFHNPVLQGTRTPNVWIWTSEKSEIECPEQKNVYMEEMKL